MVLAIGVGKLVLERSGTRNRCPLFSLASVLWMGGVGTLATIRILAWRPGFAGIVFDLAAGTVLLAGSVYLRRAPMGSATNPAADAAESPRWLHGLRGTAAASVAALSV